MSAIVRPLTRTSMTTRLVPTEAVVVIAMTMALATGAFPAVAAAQATQATRATRAAQAAKAPAFTKADQLRLVRTLCGATRRGTATDDLTAPAETVDGFLTPDGSTLFVELLSTEYVERNVTKRALVFGGHLVVDGTIDSGEASRTDVCAGVLEVRGGKWTPVSRAKSLAETGFNGRNPEVTLQAIGADRHVLQITQGLWNSGSSMTFVTLYEPEGQAFAERLSVATSADDCGSEPPCFRYEGTLAIDPSAAAAPGPAGVPDIQLQLKGTYRNEDGKVVKIPAAPLALRLTNGAYAPVSSTTTTLAFWTMVQSPW